MLSYLIVSSVYFAAVPSFETGSLLTYRGHIIAEKGEPEESRKTFEFSLFIAKQDSQGVSLNWIITENKRGSWPWPEHFGELKLDSKWQGEQQFGPSLLYARNDGITEISIMLPFLEGNRSLADSLIWNEGRLNYRVIEPVTRARRDTWQVEVHNSIGKKRTLWIERSSPLIVGMSESVFMGPGIKYNLQLDLGEIKNLSSANSSKLKEAFEKLIRLRRKLGRRGRSRTVDWNDEQLSILKRELPALSKMSIGTPLAEVLSEAVEDIRFQRERKSAVTRLKNKYLGLKIPPFKLSGISGEMISEENFQSKVIVLHFWQYKDKPLLEPYGQIGYLDFLYRRHKDEDVKVIGIHVADKQAEEGFPTFAIRGIKKLKSFMNLSYPIFLDSGELLTKLGDPRKWGARLPLFIVVGQNGEIVHYHTGIYKVNRDRGLEELDNVIMKTLETAE